MAIPHTRHYELCNLTNLHNFKGEQYLLCILNNVFTRLYLMKRQKTLFSVVREVLIWSKGPRIDFYSRLWCHCDIIVFLSKTQYPSLYLVSVNIGVWMCDRVIGSRAWSAE